ncbi:MAG: glycoside hydrolase family 99-like domain-containing protein [Bacteroidales bacterium]|nr:glycoside hydrolase family 99-like domain-containing protein [Bacteroidales bacterium]
MRPCSFSIALIIGAALLVSCRMGKQDYNVCAYVWPSCHDDSLAHKWLWADGEGEWEVIRKGNPRFEGHYQPKQPLWGYELDDDPKVVEKWIKTALKYGVNTFIYDWYWYNAPDGWSGPYLEDALYKGFLGAPSNKKMNFYIMYANHKVKYSYWNYHKWGADADSLLFDPRVGMEDWKKIVHRVITRYFNLPNYVKIDGCPVFAMFNADIFRQGFSSDAEASDAMEYFREEVRKAGFPGLHLQLTPGGGSDPSAERQVKMNDNIKLLGINSIAFYNMGGFDCDYVKHNENAVRMRDATDAAYDIPLFPTVSIGWDDTPRFPAKGEKHVTRFNHSPEVFGRYLQIAKDYADIHRDSQPPFVMINAWNEWVEGSYLLPDKIYGFDYLEAVKTVFN